MLSSVEHFRGQRANFLHTGTLTRTQDRNWWHRLQRFRIDFMSSSTVVPLQENRSFDCAAKWRRHPSDLVHMSTEHCFRSSGTHTPWPSFGESVTWIQRVRLYVALFACGETQIGCAPVYVCVSIWKNFVARHQNTHSCVARRPHLTEIRATPDSALCNSVFECTFGAAMLFFSRCVYWLENQFVCEAIRIRSK